MKHNLSFSHVQAIAVLVIVVWILGVLFLSKYRLGKRGARIRLRMLEEMELDRT